MRANEAKILSLGLNSIFLDIKRNSTNGLWELVADLNEGQIETLMSLGYAIFKHREFNVPTGKYLISWKCNAEDSFGA